MLLKSERDALCNKTMSLIIEYIGDDYTPCSKREYLFRLKNWIDNTEITEVEMLAAAALYSDFTPKLTKQNVESIHSLYLQIKRLTTHE